VLLTGLGGAACFGFSTLVASASGADG